MTTDTVGAMLRTALVVTVPTALAGIGLARGLGGAVAVTGAGMGAALVLVSGAFSLAVLRAACRLEPVLMLLIALATYFVKVIALGTFFSVVVSIGLLDGSVDRTAVGLSIIACTLSWTTGEVWAALRDREPLFQLDESGVR